MATRFLENRSYTKVTILKDKLPVRCFSRFRISNGNNVEQSITTTSLCNPAYAYIVTCAVYIKQGTGNYIRCYGKLHQDLLEHPHYQILHHSNYLHEISTQSKLQHLHAKIEQRKKNHIGNPMAQNIQCS